MTIANIYIWLGINRESITDFVLTATPIYNLIAQNCRVATKRVRTASPNSTCCVTTRTTCRSSRDERVVRVAPYVVVPVPTLRTTNKQYSARVYKSLCYLFASISGKNSRKNWGGHFCTPIPRCGDVPENMLCESRWWWRACPTSATQHGTTFLCQNALVAYGLACRVRWPSVPFFSETVPFCGVCPGNFLTSNGTPFCPVFFMYRPSLFRFPYF